MTASSPSPGTVREQELVRVGLGLGVWSGQNSSTRRVAGTARGLRDTSPCRAPSITVSFEDIRV